MWCVRVPTGAFVARRNGKVFVTGNSGFPKSLDAGKAIDKHLGASREVVGTRPSYRPKANALRDPAGFQDRSDGAISLPATDEAIEWDGYGTALKPAVEPICLARKPLSESSVAKNILRWGTGAINIDACRIPVEDESYATNCSGRRGHDQNRTRGNDAFKMTGGAGSDKGRWPANLVLDEEAAEALDQQAGERASGANPTRRGSDKFRGVYAKFEGQETCVPARGADTGGASRFFFTAKPSLSEREDGLHHLEPRTMNRVNPGGLENDPKWAPVERRNTHPTVKPFALMEWLVKLVSPPNAIICDPFMGSGPTGMAAVALGHDFVGMDLDPHHIAIAEGRIKNVAPLLVTTAIHESERKDSGVDRPDDPLT